MHAERGCFLESSYHIILGLMRSILNAIVHVVMNIK